MRTTELGTSGIYVSVIALGTWPMVGDANWGPQDERQSIATIREALDLEINFFDTAEAYGNGYAETLLGKALGERRSEAVIASKVSPDHLHYDDVKKACEASLRRLNTEWIDLYQVHWPNHAVPFEETFQALLDLQREGKIRAIGVSNFGVQDLTAALELAPVQSNQLPYSLLWRAIEYEIQPLCVEKRVSILCYSPLLMGLLAGKFRSADEVPPGRARTRHFSSSRPLARHGEAGQEELTFETVAKIRTVAERLGVPMADLSLAWLLKQPGVASVLVGARNPEQLRENARAAELSLSEEVVQELSRITEPLKEAFGPNPDMWQGESRYR